MDLLPRGYAERYSVEAFRAVSLELWHRLLAERAWCLRLHVLVFHGSASQILYPLPKVFGDQIPILGPNQLHSPVVCEAFELRPHRLYDCCG